MNIPTRQDLDDWRELIYAGDTSVTMRMEEFERLMHAAELLLRIRERAKANRGVYVAKHAVYMIDGVVASGDFIEDVRRADNDQSLAGSTCPGCHCVLYDDAAIRGWCRDCDPDQEPNP